MSEKGQREFHCQLRYEPIGAASQPPGPSDNVGCILFVNKESEESRCSIFDLCSQPFGCLQDIAFTMARRFGLPGADELFQRQFNQLFASGDYEGRAL